MRATDSHGKNLRDQPRGIWHPIRNGKSANANLKANQPKLSVDTTNEQPTPDPDPHAESRKRFFE